MKNFYTITLIEDGEPHVYVTKAEKIDQAIENVTAILQMDIANAFGWDPDETEVNPWILSVVRTGDKPIVTEY